MSFSSLFKCQNPGLRKPIKAPLSEVNTSSPTFLIREGMDETELVTYHDNLIYLLDKVFVMNNMHFLSIDQERFMSMFFNQAGVVTDALNMNEENPYKTMDNIMSQLDNFLGSYFGEDYGKYSR